VEHGGLNMKAMKKNDLGVSPVIAVILMVAITVVLAGVVFLWAQSFTDDAEGDVRSLNIKVSLYSDTADAADKLEIEVLGGTIIWTDYKVVVFGEATITDTDGPDSGATDDKSNAGDTAVFNLDGDGSTINAGEGYKVQIIDLEGNKVIYTNENVIATSYNSA